MYKIFVADDKFTDVIAILERRGWARSRDANSPNFLLKWRNLSNINFRLLRSDQFVNHVFNSQQLSNKALLTQNLSFLQHQQVSRSDAKQEGVSRLRKNAVESRDDLQEKRTAAPGNDDVDAFQTADGAGKVGSSGDSCETVGVQEPEVFFPRCWDVSEDGGVASLLKAFAVSAAVALLRSFVAGEDDNGTTSTNTTHDIKLAIGCHTKEGEGLAAAISIISLYVASLPHDKNRDPSSSHEGEASLNDGGDFSRRSKRKTSQLRCCGQHAADTSVTLGNRQWTAVLTLWESAAVIASQKEGKGGLVAGENEEYFGQQAVGKKERQPGMAKSAFFSHVDSVKCLQNPPGTESDAPRGTLCFATLVAKARSLLREFDALDPQSALHGQANAWIVKPAGLSCGRGVMATSSLRDVLSACRELEWKAVVQKYVERPLLVQGFKFDIRQWVLVTSCNPLVLWGFDEGYIRFSSKPFTMHASSLSDRFIHLCNHCVQKEGNGGPDGIESGPFPLPGNGPAGEEVENNAVRDDGDEGIERHTGVGGTASAHGEKYLTLSPSEARCNMWTVDQLRRYLCHRFEGKHVYEDVVLPRVRNVVMQTLLSVRAELEMKGRGVEWLGFDLMLTEDLRVMLIEVNVSPDVSHSTPVTARLVPPATEDALRLLLNEGEADARIAAASVGSSSAHRADTSRPRGSPPTPMPPPPRSRASNGPMCRGTGEEGPKEGRADKAGDSFLGAGAEEEAGGGGGLKTTAFRRRVGGGGPHVEGDGDAGLDRGQLKWRLWHKGNIETPAELRKLRDAKKSLSRKCSIRRDKRQSNDGSIDDGHCARNSSCEEALGAIGLFFKKTMDAAVDAGSDASRSHSVGSPKSSGMAKSSINRSVLTAGTGLDEPSLVGDREGWRCPSSEDEL